VALATYYEKISVAHIEAGLRSFDKYAPLPKLIGTNKDVIVRETLNLLEN